MSVFWLVIAAGLMFFGRFGTDRIKSDTVGDMIFRASQIAMLGCLGLAFFSLFDRSSPHTFPAASGLWKSAWFSGTALLGAVALAWLFIARSRRMSRDELQTPELTLRYDRAEGTVHVTERGQLRAHRIAAGRLILDVTPYETDGMVRARFVLKQWPASSSLSPDMAVRAVSDVLRTDVYSNTAKAIRAWLSRHPGIELDAAAVRLGWAQKVDAMVRHARGQLPAGKVRVESFVAYDGPALDYLAILADGTVLAGTGEETLLEPVTRPLVSDGGRRIQLAVGNAYPTFSLSDDQVASLGKLHAKGQVQVIEGCF